MQLVLPQMCSSLARVPKKYKGSGKSWGILYASFRFYVDDNYQYLQHSIVPTMHFQASLPRLPIPELDKTCERYLSALKPITPAEQFMKTEEIVKHFQNGEGKVLHEELKLKDKLNKHTSYISGPWFDMYLKSRIPVVINYNPFLAFRDDPDPAYNNQLVRATNILVSSLRFRRSFRENLLEPEVYHLNPVKSDTQLFRKSIRWLPQSLAWYGAFLCKAFPLDMSQFNNLFNSTRIPCLNKDEIKSDPSAHHMLVVRKGHFYIFDVVDRDGNILPPSHLHAYLSHILNDTVPPARHPIGVLTTENRDVWAAVRNNLIELGNTEQLKLIDTAIYALILDEETLDGITESAHHLLHGPSHNRWFDKSFQLVVTKNGKTAVNFEHAWGDGVAVLRFFNEIFADSTKNHFVHPDSVPGNLDTSHLVKRLEFNLDEMVKSAIRNAQEKYQKVVDSLQLDVLQCSQINREYIKQCNLSPDSIAQLVFQMAFYKQYGKFVATYESCSTSAFKHGRTETMRPSTMATKACTKAFNKNNKAPASELRSMLEECTKVHNNLTKEAAMGQGFDRHLFGMKTLAEKKGAALPELYEDPSYAAANYYILSTSTLHGPAFMGGGFGPVVQDGFGIGYGFKDDTFSALISSYSPYQDGKGFVDCLRESVKDIHSVLEATKHT